MYYVYIYIYIYIYVIGHLQKCKKFVFVNLYLNNLKPFRIIILVYY